jgi:hypothetical protein
LEGGAVKGIVEERAVALGEYIVENKATVRNAAKSYWNTIKHSGISAAESPPG